MAVRRSTAGRMGQAAARRLPRRRAACGREGEETAGGCSLVGGGDCVWAGGGYSSPILLSFHGFLFFPVCFPTVFFFPFCPQFLLSISPVLRS
jgi:hypothetical protein